MERKLVISAIIVVAVVVSVLLSTLLLKDSCDKFRDKAVCESAVETALAAHPGKVYSVEKTELPLAPNLVEETGKASSTFWTVGIKTKENKIEVSVDEEGNTKLLRVFP